MAWSAIGAFVLALTVGIGAFGAHALRDRLDAYATGIYERAVFYQYVHGLAVVIAGLAMSAHLAIGQTAAIAVWCFIAGIVIFCGSLYALALSGVRALGAITPLGGLAFIAGWTCLGLALLR